MFVLRRSTAFGTLCTAFLLAAIFVSSCGREEGGRVYFQQALALNQGQPACPPDVLRQKAALYRKAVKADPNYADAWNNLGDVYENLGEYSKALEAYRRACKLKPDHAIAYFGIGDVYCKQGLHEKAIEAYEKGLRYKPDDRLTQSRLSYARDALASREGKGVITAKVIARGLLPGTRGVERGSDGIVNAPGVTLNSTVLPFGTDSAELTPQAREQLDELGKVLSSPEAAQYSFEVAGHTDERGSESHGMWLGAKRAEAVKSYLVSKWGVSPERLITKSYGESQPIAFGHDEASWAANRRVEIKLRESVDLPSPRTGDLRIYYGLLHAKPGGGYELVRDHGTVLRTGDTYSVYLRPKSDCYVYVYQVDSSGKGFWLFPGDGSAALQNPLKADTDYWVPRRDKCFKLDQTTGQETVYLVASSRPIEDFNSLKQQPSASAEEVVAQIQCRGVGGVKPMETPPPAAETAPTQVPVNEIFGSGEFQVAVNFQHA